MNKMMNRIMLPCKRATLLVEKKSDIGLSMLELLQLSLHTSMCDACTNYRIQSQMIDKLLGRSDVKPVVINESVVESMKAQILQRLNIR